MWRVFCPLFCSKIYLYSWKLFDKMVELDSAYLQFDRQFYGENSRVLAILEKHGLIKGAHCLTELYHAGLILTDPAYILYMCHLFADAGLMNKLYEIVDSCRLGEGFLSKTIQKETGLSLPIIEAMFKIFEAKGYGTVHEYTGNITRYMGTA